MATSNSCHLEMSSSSTHCRLVRSCVICHRPIEPPSARGSREVLGGRWVRIGRGLLRGEGDVTRHTAYNVCRVHNVITMEKTNGSCLN